MRSLKYILLLFTIFATAIACVNYSQSKNIGKIESQAMNQQYIIEEIILEYYGGMRAHREILKLNSTHISYQFQNMNQPKPLNHHKEISNELWLKMNQNFNYEGFSEIQSGDSQVVFDGMDYVFKIKGNFDDIVLTNPKYSNQHEAFFETLKALQQEFYDEIEK